MKNKTEAFFGTRYETVKHQSTGDYTDVYIVRDRETHIIYVAKILLLHRLDEEHQKRLLREAVITDRLESPHIARAIDYGFNVSGQPFCVLEHLEGLSLRERLQRDGRLAVSEASKIVCQVLSGLQTAHDAGVVHRDLKPENIFLEQLNGQYIAKILGFGLAKLTQGLASIAPAQALTPENTTVGTEIYMSPEQKKFSRSVDHRSDLYQMGLVLFECVAGKVPSWATSPLNIPEAHRKSPLQKDVDVPDEFANLMDKALHGSREERFQSAAQFARALAEFV